MSILNFIGSAGGAFADVVREQDALKAKENAAIRSKLITSFIILVMVTIYSFIYDSGVNADLWLCIWCICIVRFVDALDEI